MTSEQLAVIAGAIMSLAFSYVPGLSEWYDPLEAVYKRLIMLGVLVLVAAGALGLSCWQVIEYVSCDKPGILGLVNALLLAIMANQSTYMLTKKRDARA